MLMTEENLEIYNRGCTDERERIKALLKGGQDMLRKEATEVLKGTAALGGVDSDLATAALGGALGFVDTFLQALEEL